MVEKKTTAPVEKKSPRKPKDKGAEAVKKAQTPVTKTAPEAASGNVIPMFPATGGTVGSAALAAAPAPVTEAAVRPLTKIAEEYTGWKAQESMAKKNAEGLQKEFLGRFPTPKDAIGYKDAFIELQKNNTPDYNHPKLVTKLKEKGVWDQVKKESADADKVKAIALLDPEIELLLKDPVICEPAPRFIQVKNKKD